MINLKQKLSTLTPKVGQTIFIAVDGHGGSGKSTLAQLLAKALHAEVIHTDDFASWDNPHNWHTDMIEKVFMPIEQGEMTLTYQPTSWWDDHYPEVIQNQSVTPLMILEGVGSSRKEFDIWIAFRIFVDTPKDICLERGMERDRNNGSPEEVQRLWKTWFDEEEKYFEQDDPRVKADLVLSGVIPFEKQFLI